MEKPVYIPPTYGPSTTEIRTPLFNDLVQRLAGALSVNTPKIQVPPFPRGNRDDAQRNSSLREKWTQAFLEEIELQEGDRLFYRFMDYLCADGHACFKLIHRDDFWGEFPRLVKRLEDEGEEVDEDPKEYNDRVFNYKTGAPLPFQLQVLDPLTVYPYRSDRGLEDVLEVSRRPRFYVAKRFGIAFDAKGSPVRMGQGFDLDTTVTLSGDVEYWEHWTPTDVAFFVNRKCVEIVEHGMKRIPYFLATGTQTSSRDPAKEGLSVGHQLRHLIPALDSLLTMKTNSAFLQAYPSFKRTRQLGAPARQSEESEDENSSEQQFEPGYIYDGMGGEDLEAIAVPPVGQDVNEAINILMSLIDKVGIPSVMSGSHAPNRVSGAAYSEMLNVSRTKYTTIIRNASFAMTDMIRHLWWLVENKVQDDVPIWSNEDHKWLELGPGDINGYYRVKTIIEPLLPEDDIAQGQHAAAMVQAKLWSKRYARENKMGIEAPEEMDDEILVEDAMDLPQVKMYLLMKALERAQMDDLKDLFNLTIQAAEQQLGQLTGQAGAATAPGQPGLPNLNPGTGGAGMPGAGGMLSAGMPKDQPPVPQLSVA